MELKHLLFVLIALVGGILWYVGRDKEIHQEANVNLKYRNNEKEKALKAMSLVQKMKAEALGQGDVSDLEWNGSTAIIIMEATGNVYEWDGFDWVDRFPNKPLPRNKK